MARVPRKVIGLSSLINARSSVWIVSAQMSVLVECRKEVLRAFHDEVAERAKMHWKADTTRCRSGNNNTSYIILGVSNHILYQVWRETCEINAERKFCLGLPAGEAKFLTAPLILLRHALLILTVLRVSWKYSGGHTRLRRRYGNSDACIAKYTSARLLLAASCGCSRG